MESLLTTPRLVIRPPVATDVARYVEYVKANRSHLAPWEPLRSPQYFTPAHWQANVVKIEQSRREDRAANFILFGLEDPGNIIGTVSISNIVRGSFQAAHLGYALAHSHVGKGLMREALAAIIRHAFTDLRLHRLMANYIPDNHRSEKLLAGLEFLKEGFACDYLMINGAWRDHVLTALVNHDWKAA